MLDRSGCVFFDELDDPLAVSFSFVLDAFFPVSRVEEDSREIFDCQARHLVGRPVDLADQHRWGAFKGRRHFCVLRGKFLAVPTPGGCLLYTSDAADE